MSPIASFGTVVVYNCDCDKENTIAVWERLHGIKGNTG